MLLGINHRGIILQVNPGVGVGVCHHNKPYACAETHEEGMPVPLPPELSLMLQHAAAANFITDSYGMMVPLC